LRQFGDMAREHVARGEPDEILFLRSNEAGGQRLTIVNDGYWFVLSRELGDKKAVDSQPLVFNTYQD